MQIMGKILGAGFGFLLAKIPGAVLGLIVGHFFDKSLQQNFSGNASFAQFFSSSEKLQSSAIFFHALFSCLGHIAKADGAVTPSEIKIATQLMDDMKLQGDVRKEAQQAFREGKDSTFPIDEILKDLKRDIDGRKDVMRVFLEILIEAAYADGELSHKEMLVLEKVAAELQFSAKELNTLLKQYAAEIRFRQTKAAYQQARQDAHQRAQEQARAWQQKAQQRSQEYSQYQREQAGKQSYSAQNRLEDAYSILNVAANCDERTLKKAYKRAMNEHHPDKLASKGLPEQALERAKAKTQDIQAAYELIKKERR